VKGLILVAMVALAGGCSHATINAGASTAGGAAPAAGSAVTGGSVGIHTHSHSLAALVITGMFIAAAIDYNQEPRPMPSFSSLADWFRGTPPPPRLDSARRISEQDCTRPIDESRGNLRCKRSGAG
jgi:hypothetical protein